MGNRQNQRIAVLIGSFSVYWHFIFVAEWRKASRSTNNSSKRPIDFHRKHDKHYEYTFSTNHRQSSHMLESHKSIEIVKFTEKNGGRKSFSSRSRLFTGPTKEKSCYSWKVRSNLSSGSGLNEKWEWLWMALCYEDADDSPKRLTVRESVRFGISVFVKCNQTSSIFEYTT